MTVRAPEIPAYRVFAVHVARVTRLSPSFLRVCFTGAELAGCAPLGLDQRIKLLLANALEGAVFRATRAAADHGSRRAFASLTGSWPGDEAAEPE